MPSCTPFGLNPRRPSISNPSRPPKSSAPHDLCLGVLACLLALLAFAALAHQVFHGDLPRLDQALENQVAAWREPHLTGCMQAISLLADWRPITAVVAALLALCAIRRTLPRDLRATVELLAVTFLVNTALKGWFHRPRPSIPPPLVDEAYYSFPSGHSITAFCLYGFLAFLAGRRLHHRGRRIAAWGACATAIAAVGLSRVYLGAHFPSDVLAGFLAGVPVLTMAILAHGRESPATGETRGRKERTTE